MRTSLFIELLKVSLGTRDKLSREPSVAEWGALLSEARRHAVVGVLACGIERLPLIQQPPKDLLFQWISQTLQIESQNTKTLKTSEIVISHFEEKGFNCCLLKGISNYRYYPSRMKNRRSCGDVDVWVVPKVDRNGKYSSVKQVLEYVASNYEMNGLCWLHCNYTDGCGVPIEVHFRPSFMNEPYRNKLFLRHFANLKKTTCLEEIEGITLPVMTVDEDVIYQMNHIYRHLIDEGIGLRQVVDYYWLLIDWSKRHMRSREETMRIISVLGMKRFAGALMYVLHDTCGLSEDKLLCPAVVSDGVFLRHEIMVAGNFGRYDPRMTDLPKQDGLSRQLSQALRRAKRNMRFLVSYPGEVIWEPFARVWHYVWKRMKLWRFSAID